MTNKKYLKVLLWAAVAVWMAVIFMFSAETAAESTETSDGIVDIFADKLMSDRRESLSESEFAAVKENISLLVRKAAHFSSYMLLGILVTSALYQHDIKSSARRLVSFIICVLYAASDELHQVFVPGRAGRVTDVLIDSAGALCGILLAAAAAALVRRLRGKRSTR